MQAGFKQNLRILRKRSLLGQIVVTLLGLELIFFASFCSLNLPVATKQNLETFSNQKIVSYFKQFSPQIQEKLFVYLPNLRQQLKFSELENKSRVKEVRYSQYVPLLPVSLAIAYALDLPLAIIVTALYFVLGLLGPNLHIFPFASGGGLNYWTEPGFGYLLGIVFGAWFASAIISEDRKSWQQVLATFGGTSIIHLFGFVWLFGSSISILLFEGETAYLHWQPWLAEQIRNLSWYSLPYDLLFSTILISLAFPLRVLFSILTAPDIANRNKHRVDPLLNFEEEDNMGQLKSNSYIHEPRFYAGRQF